MSKLTLAGKKSKASLKVFLQKLLENIGVSILLNILQSKMYAKCNTIGASGFRNILLTFCFAKCTQKSTKMQTIAKCS